MLLVRRFTNTDAASRPAVSAYEFMRRTIPEGERPAWLAKLVQRELEVR